MQVASQLWQGTPGMKFLPMQASLVSRKANVSPTASPLPFSLRYAGQADLSDVASLRLQRDATEFDGRFKLYDVLGWIDQAGGSPLPPMDGHLHSPELEISGAVLEGVDIVIDDEDVR